MGFGIKEAIAAYIKSGLSGDMAVRVDESPDVVAVGRRGGKIVPILQPGSTLTGKEIMEKAGIRPYRRVVHGRVNILSNLPISFLPSRVKKSPNRLH